MRFGEQEDEADASGQGDADAPGSWFTPAPKPAAERAGFGQPGSAGSWFDPLSRGDQGPLGSRSGWEQAVPKPSAEWPGLERPRPENPSAGRDLTATRSDMPAVPGGTRPRADWRAGSWAEVTRGANSPPWPSITVEPDDPFGPPEGLPFKGARPVAGLGTLKSASAPAGPPSSFRRTQTGAFRRIRDTGAMRAIMDTNAMRTLMDTTAMQILRERYAGRGRLVAAVVISIWVLLAVVGVAVFSRHGGGTPAASATSPATTAGTGLASRPAATPPPASRKASGTGGPARVLTVASVVAFGPDGTSDGDNPGRAASVIEGSAVASWQTKWYRTARFGTLKSGTGLLLDMGNTVTISTVELKLTPGSADLKVRVGRTVGSLVLAATRAGVGGTVYVHLATPATGRYVEIWFTALPRDTTGTYQETVYRVQVSGRP